MASSQLFDRPVLTEEPGASTGGRAARRKARARRARKSSLPARYLGYVGYFVGAGLISGAVVHHPLDPARYTRIAVYGILVFLAATVLNELVLAHHRPGLPRMLVVIGASLLLSFGIGMLSGGLQHFDDFPARGAVLVPLGITVSFVAYVIKDADTPWQRIFSLVGLAVFLAAAVSFVGLRQVAASMDEPSEGSGHSHGNADEPGQDTHGTDEAPPTTGAQAPSSSPPADSGTSPKPGHDDGHSH
ncbi:hypothetical protein [Streptomyces sp. NBC_00140]|uniref:hypothetical protein n=1 Tax=Streptomyces sp. NBC_00140 TaxID=2975664 RepID=UPI002251784C|nr:hypothetical protein [Streptomyces sp. NBC_00140]MCX5336707.1 hypothetical protein [Streptomyces sp. NBC_00140]